jgi:hypothetical protein
MAYLEKYMIQKNVRNTLTFALMLTGMAAATAQAGDIKPLHHACYAGNSINWPKPVGAGSPGGVGTSINPAHGGSGALGAAVGAFDEIRFVCPAGTNSFEINVRNKLQNTLTPDRVVRATFAPPAPTAPYTFVGGISSIRDVYRLAVDALRWNQAAANGLDTGPATISLPVANWPAGQTLYDVRVDKVGGGTNQIRQYELCVACYSGENETGVQSQPTSASYLTNQ